MRKSQTGDRAVSAWRGAYVRFALVCLLAPLLIVIGQAAISRAGAPGTDWIEPPSAGAGRGDPPVPTPTLPRTAEVAPPSSNAATPTRTDRPRPPTKPRAVLDPSARLLNGDDASEAWVLYIELASGHRITQRFLLSNAGPGEHNAVALGHILEPGRAPFRYENGRRRARWTLSDDRLFFDIAASHLDLHRPSGELRISKEDVEIQLFFDFDAQAPSARVPAERLPPGYQVEVLAVGAATRGTLRAPWMDAPLETTGRTWLVHTFTNDEEAGLLARRVDVFGRSEKTAFYAIELQGRGDWRSGWAMTAGRDRLVVESGINVPAAWRELPGATGPREYPKPAGFEMSGERISGLISLGPEWLRFDPLEVLPQPFQWFVRRSSKPREVWADATIGVSISATSDPPSLPNTDETTSAKIDEATRFESRSNRETEGESVDRSVTGVASITFLNPK